MNASHFKNAGRKQRGNDARNVQRRPEGGQANRKLLRRVEVSCEQDCAHRQHIEEETTQSRLTGSRNETTLARSDQRACDVKSNLARHESLRPRHQRPHHHEQRQNLLETVSLDQKLNRKFGSQKTQKLHRRSIVVIVLCHAQIR
jgi:hypothetical protein